MTVKVPLYTQNFLQNIEPNEVHGLGGDCRNPKCDYVFTPDNKKEIQEMDGFFSCPKCWHSFNYAYDPASMRLSGITPNQMGDIGETIIEQLGNIPGIGKVLWRHKKDQDPLDFIIGDYGVEVKTKHSEAVPRFTLGDAYERKQKIIKANDLGLQPALIGVRLNFYKDHADLFFRPELSDSWIGQKGFRYLMRIDFSHLNPFRSPDQVPPPNMLPSDDE